MTAHESFRKPWIIVGWVEWPAILLNMRRKLIGVAETEWSGFGSHKMKFTALGDTNAFKSTQLQLEPGKNTNFNLPVFLQATWQGSSKFPSSSGGALCPSGLLYRALQETNMRRARSVFLLALYCWSILLCGFAFASSSKFLPKSTSLHSKASTLVLYVFSNTDPGKPEEEWLMLGGCTISPLHPQIA